MEEIVIALAIVFGMFLNSIIVSIFYPNWRESNGMVKLKNKVDETIQIDAEQLTIEIPKGYDVEVTKDEVIIKKNETTQKSKRLWTTKN